MFLKNLCRTSHLIKFISIMSGIFEPVLGGVMQQSVCFILGIKIVWSQKVVASNLRGFLGNGSMYN